jgi:hypothetical protein
MCDEDLGRRRRILAAAARDDRDGCLLKESAAQGAPDQSRDAVAQKAEAMLVSGGRCSMRAEEARDGLNGQSHKVQDVGTPPSTLALEDLFRATGLRCATGRNVGRDQIAELGMSVATVVHQECDQ